MATIIVDPTDISPDSDPEIPEDQNITIPESDIVIQPEDLPVDENAFITIPESDIQLAPAEIDDQEFDNAPTEEDILYAPVGIDTEEDPGTPDGLGDPVSFGDINGGPGAIGSSKGLAGRIANTRAQATEQDNVNAATQKDWRVKLSLAPNADYLYKAKIPGILAPLAKTEGVIFPYTPSISVTNTASYDPFDVVHSNYKIFNYKNSSVDNIQITCDFTAQDTYEANYVLAVIHFFRSVTKMFYGKDQNPIAGTPPPLCYLTGLGDYQFNAHPLAITSFTYNLPTDVDYIRANIKSNSSAGVNESQSNNSFPMGGSRLIGVQPGGLPQDPAWSQPGYTTGGTTTATYVPTKIQITIGAVPIVSRNTISNYFSVRDFATGKLLLGKDRVAGGKYGGVW